MNPVLRSLLASGLVMLLPACVTPQATAGTMDVSILVDGQSLPLSIPAGSTAQQVLQQAQVELGQLDLVEPPGYTVLTGGSQVVVIRRTERFEIEQIVIPFSRQTVSNEGLPAGETRLLQPGENGLEEITYRVLEEEGLEVSRQPAKRTVVQEPRAEILMVGTQAFHTPVAIEGRLALLSAGNAWVLQGDSTNRRPVVVSGDLDGQVFQLSPDGRWLLFSRSMEEGDQDFNALWVVDLETPGAEPVDLQARNVVHFAEWSPEPSSTTVAYSTVEPRPSPPGWQANNDLVLVDLNQSGRAVNRRELLAANAGGQYGWWGTSFAWAPDGVHMAYARADSVGVIDLRQAELQDTHSVIPYETRADWAWVPGIAWGYNSRTLYLVEHGRPLGLEDDTASPVFDLIALPSAGADPLSLVTRTGMFAYPAVSPATVLPTGEVAYQVAFLQAVSPLESEASSYRLTAMDRDGSNLRQLFPAAGEPGLSQEDLSAPVWSPTGEQLAVVYRGDLWIVNAGNGAAQPVTGDGQAAAVDWTP